MEVDLNGIDHLRNLNDLIPWILGAGGLGTAWNCREAIYRWLPWSIKSTTTPANATGAVIARFLADYAEAIESEVARMRAANGEWAGLKEIAAYRARHLGILSAFQAAVREEGHDG